MRDVVIDQPAGAGDIFFIQKLIHVLAQEGVVYHPIAPACWNNGVWQVISDAITFRPGELVVPENARVIDLSHQPMPRGYIDTMISKYTGLNIDWGDWANHFKYMRQRQAELDCLEYYGIDDGEPFILCNEFFGTKPAMNRAPAIDRLVPDDYDGKVININPDRPDSSVFDYCRLFELAEQIHTVDTCFLYIIETLDISADRLVVYPRHGEATVQTIAQLFKQPWEWIR